MNATLPHYQLQSLAGEEVAAPAGQQAIVCFIKEDCPTCREVMPVLAALHAQFGATMPVHVIGQTSAGNATLNNDFSPPFDILDDGSLKISFAANIETVPTLLLTDAEGAVATTLIGFVRDEWQTMATTLSGALALPDMSLDWSTLPEWRPGCGSLSVDPSNEARLRAEAEDSPIRARQIEIGSADDPFEFMFDQGFSDGLPVVPPTPERVMRMLAGTSRDPQDVIAIMPPNMGEVTVEKAAINAVMAGCLPAYLPVIIAAVEAICTDEYNIHGVMATTMGATPVMVVNGPIRHQLDMNMGMGALGQGNRANATIGRAVRLIVRNVGGAKPGQTERSTLGNPMKFTMCFAEDEERSPWSPLHVERGFEADDSVVSMFTMTSGPTLIVDQDSRSGAPLAGTLGLTMKSIFNPRAHFATNCLLVVAPEHVDTFVRDGYGKAEIRRRIQEVTATPVRDLVADEVSGVGIKPDAAAEMGDAALNQLMPKFRTEEDIHIVVAGSDAGKFSGVFHGWLTGHMGSIPVSRKIQR